MRAATVRALGARESFSAPKIKSRTAALWRRYPCSASFANRFHSLESDIGGGAK